MVTTDSIEGTISEAMWFHYDVACDVLYLRRADARDEPVLGEETADGFVLLRRESDDQPVGLTIVNWWKRFGEGHLPDSLRELENRIAPWASKVAA